MRRREVRLATGMSEKDVNGFLAALAGAVSFYKRDELRMASMLTR